MFEIDLTRVLFAFLCGYFLALSGSLSQLVTNNSLASPSTLGFDGMAALAVIVAQNILLVLNFPVPLEYASFAIFALFCAPFTLWLLKRAGTSPHFFSFDMKLFILAGLAFNLFVGAVFAVVQFLFMALNWDFPSGLWFGNFRFYHESALALFLGVFLLIQLILRHKASQLRVLSLGESMALGFGVDVKGTQKWALLVSLFLTGLVISFFGVFSFLSLIIPHMLRFFLYFERNMKNELIWGPVAGGAGLAGLDYLCFRHDFHGAELPAGMVSSVIGAFLLILLLLKSQFKNFAKE